MRSTSMNNQISFLFTGVVCVLFAAPAQAWQFRELDSMPKPPQTDDAITIESSDLIDLIPTDQTFSDPSAPIVNASEVVTGKLLQPSESKKSMLLDLAPIPDPGLEPLPDPTPNAKPAAKPATKTLAKPVPEPMPELNAATPALKAAPASKNPLQVFKDGMTPAGPRKNVYTAHFRGVEVGRTKEKELISKWGEPLRKLDHDDGTQTLVYDIPSFQQVDVTTKQGSIAGVLVHLLDAKSAGHVEKQLGIGNFRAVPIPDEYGEVLGQAYPERGLLFSFSEESTSEAVLVSAILLEPVSAEMFRLRAQYDFSHNYEQSLADLDEAIRIDPLDAEAYWLRSEYLDACGRTRAGLKSAQKAIRLKPTNPVYRLSRSRLFAKTNRLQQGIEEIEAVLDELDLTDEVAGRAHNLLGDLMAIGPDADHQKALKHHLKAIDHASKSVDDRRFAVRRLAKHTLVRAHMSVARDIAMGNFQRQLEVVPKWLLRATDLADEFISDDQGDPLLQMEIFRDTLASYSELQQGKFEAAIATEEAINTGRDLIANATDELYKTQIERLLSETLLHAAKIHRARGKHTTAMQFATTGLALIENSESKWEETAHDNYLQAQLQFVIGSINAIKSSNHAEAVEWYTKARSSFVGSNFATPLYSDRSHGEMYVSMGLSFWEIGEKDKGMRITQTGAELMKDAVEDGSLQLRAMSVPYGNLAAMHGKLGHGEKSQQYAKLATKVDNLTNMKR